MLIEATSPGDKCATCGVSNAGQHLLQLLLLLLQLKFDSLELHIHLSNLALLCCCRLQSTAGLMPATICTELQEQRTDDQVIVHELSMMLARLVVPGDCNAIHCKAVHDHPCMEMQLPSTTAVKCSLWLSMVGPSVAPAFHP